MTKEEININYTESLLHFEKDGKSSYFDYKDGKWQFWGDVPVDESAKMLFKRLGEMIDLKKVKKNKLNK
jgi:hypothetical protein